MSSQTLAAPARPQPPINPHPGRDLVSIRDLSPIEVESLFHLSALVKARPQDFRTALAGKHIAMFFEKPSLRTRLTFEAGICGLGGSVSFIDQRHERLEARETLSDIAHNVERWVSGIVLRTFAHETVAGMAELACVPVINALSEVEHPCQALADYFTLHEKFGNLRKICLAYVGDGNNVMHSLLLTSAVLGSKIRIATPKGYGPNPQILADAHDIAKNTGAIIELMTDPHQAVRGVDAVYTDAWTSMGHEHETEERAKTFPPYQVNDKLMAGAAPHAVFMHCLPAHRNEEVTDAIIDSVRSIVFDQAENRMHVQKAILMMLVGGKSRQPLRSAHA
ncbi:MAG: ornithine carbamoyltransferase [Acidobacteriaceae bacterium]|nr:ornithine carbamoyltransferase [Acidobacteriaceae bacterium]